MLTLGKILKLMLTNTIGSVADMMCGAANTMVQPGSVSPRPYMAKNKFLFNEYLGIFMHLRAYFFIFLNLENSRFFLTLP